ncbi:hypothetical protein [Lewinella sp. JB7]|uniref:hypothetical protein n=1 Tax=Lewinella sp. JB7 TaxID=2962887 RepID=UPI0020C94B08|nr:hypothetical protein [Lewinella sp. JB7]MCP9234572.1 hypothetical protein [Lewinella sp. JB7]
MVTSSIRLRNRRRFTGTILLTVAAGLLVHQLATRMPRQFERYVGPELYLDPAVWDTFTLISLYGTLLIAGAGLLLRTKWSISVLAIFVVSVLEDALVILLGWATFPLTTVAAILVAGCTLLSIAHLRRSWSAHPDRQRKIVTGVLIGLPLNLFLLWLLG